MPPDEADTQADVRTNDREVIAMYQPAYTGDTQCDITTERDKRGHLCDLIIHI